MNEILGVFGINWKILVFQIVNFGLLLVVLYHFLYKPISDILDKRKGVIQEGLKKAEEAEAHLFDAENTKKDIISKATKEAESIVGLSQQRSQKMKDDVLKDAEVRKDEIIMKAKKQAENEREDIMKKGREEIAKLAVLATEKILREK